MLAAAPTVKWSTKNLRLQNIFVYKKTIAENCKKIKKQPQLFYFFIFLLQLITSSNNCCNNFLFKFCFKSTLIFFFFLYLTDFISETPFDKLSDAGVEELSDVESFVVVKKVDVANLAEENESTGTGDIITEIDDKPLTAEEIETLSTLVDQAAMEILVNTSASNIMMLVQESNALQKQAAEALREYLRSFASALRVPQEASDYAERTKLVSAMESKAQEKFDIAKQKELSIKEEMESLRNLVNAVRESGESEVADAAEKSLNTCTEEMKNVLSEIDVVQRDFDFLLDYQKFIGHAPESLRGHLNSFAVDLVKLLEENKVDLTGLSQDQAIMALALKRTEVLERALEANPDSKYLEDRLKKQQLELKNLAEENLCMELKCLENKMSLEHKMQVL